MSLLPLTIAAFALITGSPMPAASGIPAMPSEVPSDGVPLDQLAPGDALGLAPRPVTVSGVALPAAPVHGQTVGAPPVAHPSATRPSPWVPLPMGIGAGIAGSVTTRRNRRRTAAAEDPIYVIVHGNGGSASDFDPLLELMGVERDQVVAFDYRSVAPGRSSTEVSRWVDTTDVAAALDAQLREVAARHGSVYSIHHSKGAAAGVLAIAALDDGTRPPIEGYRGAALLDPPIARRPLGTLQRFGQRFGWAPDNGGFHPIRCDEDGCRDVRAYLGDASDVEVIVVRNPDALVTNFTDEPEGLRVYDLEFDGKPSAWSRWWFTPSMAHRIFEAHSSVLGHRSVADCITAEASTPGSCRWDGSPRRRRWPRGSGGGRNLTR